MSQEGILNLILTTLEITSAKGSKGRRQGATAMRDAGEQRLNLHRQVSFANGLRDLVGEGSELKDHGQQVREEGRRLEPGVGEKSEEAFLTMVKGCSGWQSSTEIGDLHGLGAEHGAHDENEIVKLGS